MVIDILNAQEAAGDGSDGGFGNGEGSTSTGDDSGGTGEKDDGDGGFGSSEVTTSTGAEDSNADAGDNESSNGTTGEGGGEAVTLEDTDSGAKDSTSSAVAVTTTIMSAGACLLSFLMW